MEGAIAAKTVTYDFAPPDGGRHAGRSAPSSATPSSPTWTAEAPRRRERTAQGNTAARGQFGKAEQSSGAPNKARPHLHLAPEDAPAPTARSPPPRPGGPSPPAAGLRPADLANPAPASGRAGLHHPFPEHQRPEPLPGLRLLCGRAFPTWEAVRDARPQAVIQAIRTAGLANLKGPRIQQALQAITEERGRLELDFLRELTPAAARDWLVQLKGVGPKTAAIVLQFSLGMPAFPVDTHIHRVPAGWGCGPRRPAPSRPIPSWPGSSLQRVTTART